MRKTKYLILSWANLIEAPGRKITAPELHGSTQCQVQSHRRRIIECDNEKRRDRTLQEGAGEYVAPDYSLIGHAQGGISPVCL